MGITLLLLITVSSVSAADSYRLNNGGSITIDAHGICAQITNSSGVDIFIPVRTPSEWASVRSHVS